MRRALRNRALIGIAWMVFASTLFAAGNAFVKALAPRIPFWESVFTRSVMALTVAAIMTARARASFRGVNRPVLLLRGALGTAALMCYYYAISTTQLGVAVMVAHTIPLFVAIFAVIFLKERLRPALAGLLVVGFLGVTLILSPNLTRVDASALIALVAAAFAGGAYTCLRHLRRSDEPATIVFYYAVISTLVSLPFFLSTFVRPSWPELGMLVGVGLTATLAQFGLTIAYRHAQAAVISPFSYWTVIVSYLYGIALFEEIPTWSALVGSAVVMGVGILIGWSERRIEAPESDSAALVSDEAGDGLRGAAVAPQPDP